MKHLFTFFLIFSVQFLVAQSYTTNPALNNFTTSTFNYIGCSSNGQTIRARVISISGTTATIQVSMKNGTTFGNSGSLFIRTNSPCSSTSLNSISYNATSSFANITVNLQNLMPNQSLTIIPVMFSFTGIRRHSGPITFTNSCPSNFMWYSQADQSWAKNKMNNNCTIQNAGCVISCIAMLLASQEGNNPLSFTPATLNNYLNNVNGYVPTCSLSSWSLAANMDGPGGVVFQSSNSFSNNWTWLDGQLNLCRKVIVKVNNGNHWVLISAKNGPSGIASSYKVLDPGNSFYSNKTLSNFNNTFIEGRSYSGNWKANLPYLQENSTEFRSNSYEEEYETIFVEGTDGWLIPKKKVVAQNDDLIQNFKPSELSIEVYPNPISAETFTINIQSDMVEKLGFQLWNSIGQQLYEGEINLHNTGQLHYFDASQLQNGLYFLTVKSQSKSIIKKLIIQRY